MAKKYAFQWPERLVWFRFPSMQQPFVHVGPQTSGRWVILSPYSSEFVADSASRTEAWCKAWIGQHFDSRISVICWWNYTCSAGKLNLMLKWPWPELFLLLHQISQSVVVAEARQSSIWSSAGLEGIWPQTCVSRVCPSVHHGCKPLLRWNPWNRYCCWLQICFST